MSLSVGWDLGIFVDVSRAPINIVLIEDVPLIQRMVTSQLADTSLPHALTAFGTLAEGMAHLKKSATHVVLLDLCLPDSDGASTFTAVRDAHPEVPIIILTASADQETALETIRGGAQDFVNKEEISGRLLTRMIQYAIERKQLDREKDNINAELARTASLLRDAVSSRDRLLGMASHDLRNPLTLISCYLELFSEGRLGGLEKRQADAVRVMQKHCSYMIDLLNDLLDINSFESGKLDLQRATINLARFLGELCEHNDIIASSKGIRIVLSAPVNLPEVEWDVQRMTQVLNNLLSNAIKFSSSGTAITVAVKTEAEQVLLIVTDQGQGIPEAEILKLFTPFSRTSVKATAGEKSTGLGLSIVKKLVEAHSGTVSVQSTVGKGTSFTLSLPLR